MAATLDEERISFITNQIAEAIKQASFHAC